MKRPLRALAVIAFLTAAAYAEPAVRQFCTMDQAVDRLLDVAQAPEEYRNKPIVRQIAEDIVAEKMVENPGKQIQITWKDVYDLNGTVNAWLCNNGQKWACVLQGIDAVGSGLTGTKVGKVLMGTGLALAGPPGFVMLAGMGVTQETFQCQPSTVKMAIEAGAAVAVILPWCKVPGVDQACVSASNGIKQGALAAARKLFGEKVAVKTLVKETKGGIEVVLVKAEKVSQAAGQNAAASTLEKPASQLASRMSVNGKKPDINFDGGGSRPGLTGEPAVSLGSGRGHARTGGSEAPSMSEPALTASGHAKTVKSSAPPPPWAASVKGMPEVMAVRRAENAALRASHRFREDIKAVGVTEEQLLWMQAKKAPLGFKNPAQYQQFRQELDITLKKSGLPDAEVGLKGTSTSFYSENPGKRLGHHWDADKLNPSDYDLNLVSEKMVALMEREGVKLGSHGVFSTRNIRAKFPELERFSKKWTEALGRDVNFVGLPQAETWEASEFILRTVK